MLHSCGMVENQQKAKQYLSEELKARIEDLFRAGNRMPKRVLRILREENRLGNLDYVTEPSINQLKYHIKKLKQKFFGNGEISLTEMKEYLQNVSAVPEDDDEPFCIGFQVIFPATQTLEISENEETDCEQSDEDEPENENDPFFFCLFATKRLLRSSEHSPVLCADSTFKLVWQGFSGILLGTVDMKKQFHKYAFGMSSREKSEDWRSIFQVKILRYYPSEKI